MLINRLYSDNLISSNLPSRYTGFFQLRHLSHIGWVETIKWEKSKLRINQNGPGKAKWPVYFYLI